MDMYNLTDLLVYDTDTDRHRWYCYICVVESEQSIWNNDTKKWEVDKEYEYFFQNGDWDEMDKLEKRAKTSIRLRKKAFDKREGELRKAFKHPDWVIRMWFYLTTTDETCKKKYLNLEKSLEKQQQEKERKKEEQETKKEHKKARDKLFKRLQSTFKKRRR